MFGLTKRTGSVARVVYSFMTRMSAARVTCYIVDSDQWRLVKWWTGFYYDANGL